MSKLRKRMRFSIYEYEKDEITYYGVWDNMEGQATPEKAGDIHYPDTWSKHDAYVKARALNKILQDPYTY